MDGHATHTYRTNLDYCEQQNIDICFLPPHTSHITQPLDIGVFNSYKAAYRRAANDPSLKDIDIRQAPEATRNRLKMLGRALIGNMHATNSKSIKRAFLHSGLYPLSFNNF
jgi:hypothetical protein